MLCKEICMQDKILGQRLKQLRESVKLSQVKVAAMLGTTQSAINRYENGHSDAPNATLLWYADYFDVSLDYIFGRCDKPQGKLYDYQPKIFENDERMQEFIEMCFDPNSAANAKLKDAVLKLLKENKNV